MTITSIPELKGSQYLRYTMLIAYTENLYPLVFAANSVEVDDDKLQISIRAFGEDNYNIMKESLRAHCYLLDYLTAENLYIGCCNIEAIEENRFNLWTLSQCYNSIGVKGTATRIKETND